MSRAAWDAEAAAFDDEPDHGLSDPSTRQAWRDLLLGVLPPAPARVADLGCGTGTLTRLLSDAGHRVDGLDFSGEMIRRAREKAPESVFVVGDAADPPLPTAAYDVVLSRHVLWAMPDAVSALTRWVALLRPGGRLLLIEGNWSTGAGLSSTQAVDAVRAVREEAGVRQLPESIYWGKEIDDERYLLVSRV